MHECQRRNILQTAKVFDLVMQSVGPYNVISSIDEMREVYNAFVNGFCSCRETQIRDVCTAWQAAEEICQPNNSVTSRLHESTETCCAYFEDEADRWQAENSTVISDCSTMESDEDVTDISVLVLEATAACGPRNGSMVATEKSESVGDGKEQDMELRPPRPSASNPSISMGPSQDLDDDAHEALGTAARDDGGGGDLKMKSSFGKRLAVHFQGPPATSMTREESVKELIARVSARKASTDLCSSTTTGRQTKLALRQAADGQPLDLKSSFMRRLLPRLGGARQT